MADKPIGHNKKIQHYTKQLNVIASWINSLSMNRSKEFTDKIVDLVVQAVEQIKGIKGS